MSERLLARLEEDLRRRPSGGRVERALDALLRRPPRGAAGLVRWHEALLFLKAYPHTRGVRSRVERALAALPALIAALPADEAASVIESDPEVAGVAGTAVTTQFTYDLVRGLAQRFPRDVAIDWEDYEGSDRLGATLPRWLPLLEEESSADANVPYALWLDAARRGRPELPWLLERFARLPMPNRGRAELFDALGLAIRWRPAARVSRTGLERPARRLFVHDRPLLARRDVSLAAELSAPPLPIRRLSRRDGGRILDMARAADASRYRELYGFTYGDPRRVLAARAGRGVEIFLNGLPPERRLPLRAGYSAFVVKNGVPVAYVEGLAFFERIEVGFNVYYTFREGESAWIYAMVLKLFHQALGSASFSVDPYQLGYENEEGIASGAFWFYRKLGFRPTDPDVAALVAREERRVAANPRHRTSAATLRRIATCNALYDFDPRPRLPPPAFRLPSSPWDRFHIRNIGLAVDRRTARAFGGDAGKMRAASSARVARALGVSPRGWSEGERRAFESLALVLDLVPDLASWSREDKRDLAAVVRAKSGPDETRSLRRMQRHRRLREALLRLGSRGPGYNI